VSYPQPTVVVGDRYHDYQTHLEWPGKPYYVQINAHDDVYLSVKAKRGYRGLNSGQRGFICSTTNPRKIERITRKYLRIAWRLNHDPKYAADTKTMVALTVAQYGSSSRGSDNA
jgi:hypothetical protein